MTIEKPNSQEAIQRREEVDMLFAKIAFVAKCYEKDPNKRDELIKPMSQLLWEITQIQEKNHELDYKRVGI